MKTASEWGLGKIASEAGLMETASSDPIGDARQAQAEAKQSACPPTASDDETSNISSVGQERGERDPGFSCSSRAFDVEFTDLLHQLANTTTGVLINAQVLGLKLPPYSHLRRPLREIERNAQRGGELMKSLLRRLPPESTDRTNDHEGTRRVDDCRSEVMGPVTAQESDAGSGNAENLPRLRNPARLLVFSPPSQPSSKPNSHHDVTVVLARFPKRDDGDEYESPNRFRAAAWLRASRKRDVLHARR